MKFAPSISFECLCLRELPAELHSLDDHAHVVRAREIICANGGGFQRVGRLQRNRAPAFWSEQRRAKTETVLFARSESVVHVISGSKQQLQVWLMQSVPRSPENSCLRDVGDQRPALEDQIPQNICKRFRV